MDKKVKAIPEGFHTVTPHLVLHDASAAIDFYKEALGAVEIARTPAPDGKSIWHAEIKIGDSILFLGDESVSMGQKSPKSLGGSPVTIHLHVEDVDAVFKRAVDAGCEVKMPPTDMFWGDRYAMVSDRFGYPWAFAQRVKELTKEEMAAASAEAAKQFAAQK